MIAYGIGVAVAGRDRNLPQGDRFDALPCEQFLSSANQRQLCTL
jgi:hypothetical protein